MRTTLDVDEKTPARLREMAAEIGISVDQLLETYVPGLSPLKATGPDAEGVALAFERWADSFPQNAPPLSDEAISRASIYRD